MGFYVGPLGIGEVGLICFSHARYSTEPLSQNQKPFSDSFLTEFSEVRQGFIGDSSPLASVAESAGVAELRSPALLRKEE